MYARFVYFTLLASFAVIPFFLSQAFNGR